MDGTTTYSAADIALMRDWLMDCAWQDMEPEDFEELSAERVIRGVARHYAGGLRQWWYDNRTVEA